MSHKSKLNWRDALLATPVSDWKTELVIALDWYDGPRSGLCRLRIPECEFYFKALDEKDTENGVERLFSISRLPARSFDTLHEVLKPFSDSQKSVWVPRDITDDARQGIVEILQRLQETSIFIKTTDFDSFNGCWGIQRARGTTEPWSAKLRVTLAESASGASGSHVIPH